MARRFHTSRVSVREADRSLEELGLLTIRRGADGGAFINEPGHDAVLRSLSLVEPTITAVLAGARPLTSRVQS